MTRKARTIEIYLAQVLKYTASKISVSRLWPFGVTWRHRSRDRLTSFVIIITFIFRKQQKTPFMILFCFRCVNHWMSPLTSV